MWSMTHETYEIRVAGLLPPAAQAQLGDLQVTSTVSTVLSGELVDQAALLGVLTRLWELELDVVEVRRVLTPTGAGAATERDDDVDDPRGDDL